MADGSRHSIAVIEEQTPGTTPSTPAWLKVRSKGATIGLTKSSHQSEELRDDRQVTDLRHGNHQVGGDIPCEFSYGSFDNLLEAVLCGAWTADVLKTGVLRKTFSIERLFDDITQYLRYTGCEFNTFNLSVPPDGMVQATFGVLGRSMGSAVAPIAGATYPAPTTSSPFDGFTGTISEGGTTLATITEIQLSLTNGMEPRFALFNPGSIGNRIGRSIVTGSLTAYFEDMTLYNKFLLETESDIEFELSDGTNKYTFTLPRIKYTGGQPDVSGETDVMLSMPFQALYDASEASNITITRGAA